MKKYIISMVLLLSVIFVTCAPSGTGDGTENGTGDDNDKPGISFPYFVYDEGTWNTALNGIKAGGNNKLYFIFVTNDFSVAGNDTINKTFGSVTGITVSISPGVVTDKGTEENKTDTIKISLKDGTKGRLLYIGDKQNVIIINSLSLKGHMSNGRPLVEIDNGGSFTMKNNTSVSGNNADNYDGGGVCVFNGTFIMQDDASVSGNKASYGGGVSVYRGSALTGTFTMQDNASVTGNTAGKGAGVSITGAGLPTFTMKDNASVSNNNATYSGGGGVIVSNGTFTMQDNTKVSGNSSAGGHGGGVFLDTNAGAIATFNMRGGVISGNSSTVILGGGGKGGGVAVVASGTGSSVFNIEKGTVYGSNETDTSLKNTVEISAAALHIEGGTAERGTFNDAIIWTSLGTLNTTENTINVLNGVSQ